jgi:hypothetical protein
MGTIIVVTRAIRFRTLSALSLALLNPFAIANGYSGFTPDAYRRRAQWFWFFPEEWAITTMPKEGVTPVMGHLEQFGAEAPGVLAKLANEPRLELIAADAEHRLYRFTSRPQQP